MTYLTIDDRTKEGKELVKMLQSKKPVHILHHPNEKTRKALRDAKAGKGEVIKDIGAFFKKVLE
ncbi:MAG: hypothetical protein JSS78_02170 [Bacteroidetes bacterium]|nr:hypothetical protein [Bacteroidota bacterium]